VASSDPENTGMKRNVEIKAKVADSAAVRDAVEKLSSGPPEVLEQEDTFFHCPRGRLKLRRLAGAAQAELLYYERPDTAGPKECRYLVHRTTDPDGLRAVLAATLGIRGTIRKQRTVFLAGQTRVHLDRVEGLGEFVELEVVLRPEQDANDGRLIAGQLMARLGLSPNQLVDGAYIDLLP
jgi:adenylate cyclase class IV